MKAERPRISNVTPIDNDVSEKLISERLFFLSHAEAEGLANAGEEEGVYSIQTVGLTKVFAKKRHRGVLGFLRKNAEREKPKNEKGETITVALDQGYTEKN